jgi:hypothetical protein
MLSSEEPEARKSTDASPAAQIHATSASNTGMPSEPASRPLDRCADVELQLVLQFLEPHSKIKAGRTCKRLLHAARQKHAWCSCPLRLVKRRGIDRVVPGGQAPSALVHLQPLYLIYGDHHGRMKLERQFYPSVSVLDIEKASFAHERAEADQVRRFLSNPGLSNLNRLKVDWSMRFGFLLPRFPHLHTLCVELYDGSGYSEWSEIHDGFRLKQSEGDEFDYTNYDFNEGCDEEPKASHQLKLASGPAARLLFIQQLAAMTSLTSLEIELHGHPSAAVQLSAIPHLRSLHLRRPHFAEGEFAKLFCHPNLAGLETLFLKKWLPSPEAAKKFRSEHRRQDPLPRIPLDDAKQVFSALVNLHSLRMDSWHTGPTTDSEFLWVPALSLAKKLKLLVAEGWNCRTVLTAPLRALMDASSQLRVQLFCPVHFRSCVRKQMLSDLVESASVLPLVSHPRVELLTDHEPVFGLEPFPWVTRDGCMNNKDKVQLLTE